MVRSNSTSHSRRSSSSTSTLTTTPKHRRSTGSLASSSAQSHQQHTYHYITQSALRQQQMLQNERDRAAANNNTNDKSVRHTRSTSNANATASNVSSNPNPPRRSNNPFTISSTQSDTPDSSRATSPQNQRHISTTSSGIGGGLGFSGGYASLGSGSRLTLPSNASPTHAYFQSGHGRDASASTGAGMSLIGNGGVGASRSGSSTGHLAPLNPFSSSASTSSHNNNTNPNSSTPDISLAVNYFPSKFSAALLDSSSSTRRRKPRSTKSGGGGGGDKMDFMDVPLPKQGGGVDAFRANSNRIPGMLDEDEDAEEEQANLSLWTGGKTKRQMKPGKRQRWNKFKWTLLFANIVLTVYTLAGLVLCLLTWFNVFEHADVLRVANRPELIISTIATSFGLFTSLLGYAGILLNNRRFLATYTFLTWLTFAFLVIPGYIACRRREYNLEGKLNLQWSRDFGTDGRARIQNELDCCGYFSPFVEATVTQTCYSRSTLPGCKLRFLKFERKVLMRWYEVVFGVVPIHVGVMVVALLCSNHVTYRFGKGMMPKRYRLSMNSMAVIMENYASQLAERYGTDFASDVMARSQSNLHLDMSNNPFTHYISNHSVSTIQSQSGPTQVYGNGGGGGGHGQSHGYGDAHGKRNGNGSGYSYGGGGGSGGGRGGGKGHTHTPTSSFGSGGVDSSTALTHASSRRPAPGFQMRVDATTMQ